MRKGDVELGSPGREKTKKDNTINTGLEAFFSHLSDAIEDTRYEAAKSDPPRLRRHTSVPGKGKPRGTLKVGFIPADAKLKIAASTHHGNEAYQKANLNAVV
ncbi:hypothetical protein PABG_12540 [Paracoccidioides brasiliensis Pb03]|nr:hypothetical protein PABG_12540 [Paracoccidioides brasiliensis Pb03]